MFTTSGVRQLVRPGAALEDSSLVDNKFKHHELTGNLTRTKINKKFSYR